MRWVHILIFLVLKTSIVGLYAQDIHYSRIDMVPSFLNPSTIGGFLGSLRVGGIYRQQWQSATTSGFKSPLVYVDAPVKGGFSKKDWFGLGFMVFNDQSGVIELTQNGVFVGAGYHKSLNADQTQLLSLGYQIGFSDRQLKAASQAIFLDELETFGTISDDRSLLNLGKQTYIDMNVGVQYRSKWSERISGTLGINIRHINTPNRSLFIDEYKPSSLMYILHASADVKINYHISLAPQIIHYRLNNSRASTVIADVAYALNGVQHVTLIAGLGLRWRDALIFGFGGAWNRFKVMMNFDIPQSDINRIPGAQGIELSGSYIFKLKRKRNVKSVFFCPRF